MLPAFYLLGAALFPPVTDLRPFPDSHDVSAELGRCREHRERIAFLRSVRGWEDGRWDRALEDLDWREGYWERLGLCHHGAGDEYRRRALAALRAYLARPESVRRRPPGQGYNTGWHPGYLPDSWKFALKAEDRTSWSMPGADNP